MRQLLTMRENKLIGSKYSHVYRVSILLLLFAVLFFIPIQRADAATTVAHFVGIATDKGGGTVSWVNPSLAAGSNATDAATVVLPSNGNTSGKLALTHFGFTSAEIPAGVIINGITVLVNWGSSHTKGIDTLVQLTKDGSA